ncbi:response regulator [Dactylosporangium sp. NPDC000244]|uniref:response regulator n=1 Tax=Dactylosporangium sp. NPDC000244 TaxID=3154365 RepID=UPI00331AD0E4
MNEEVLVVDDQKDVAESLAELIRVSIRIRAVATSDPREAVSLVRDSPIKVAVLDQRMPEITGTELSAELRSVNDKLRLIMFTGMASGEEVANAAFERGFNAMLQKADVGRLPEAVFEQYIRYQIDSKQRAVQRLSLFQTPRRYRIFGPRIKYALVDAYVIEDNFVDDDSWETFLHLSRGQEEKRTWSWSVKRSVTIEEQSQEALKHSLRGKLSGTVAQLESALEESLTASSKESRSREDSTGGAREMTYKLTDQDGAVRARHFQRAPVFRQWSVVLGVTCDQCGNPHEERIVANERLPLFATRQVDYFDDGDRKIFGSGSVKASYV